MILLIIIGAIFLVVHQLKKMYIHNWDKGITATLDISHQAVYPGTEIILTETITNRKWLPLPIIKVKFEVDRSFKFAESVENTNVTDKSYKSDAFSIMCFQRIIRRIPVTCTQRGYYWIENMDVVSSDIMMDSVLGAEFPIKKSITVYPASVDSQIVDVIYQGIMGDILTKQYIYDDPFEFRGIREYQNYDNMKTINWKASAKTGEWKVNMHDFTARQEVCILLNLENEGIWEYETLKENSISMACSLACRLAAQGIGVSIISNGTDKMTGETIYIGSGSDEGHQQNILMTLSRIDLKESFEDFAKILSEGYSKWEMSQMPILISINKKESIQKEYQKIAKKAGNAIWVCPYHSDMKCDIVDYPELKVMKWEVSR